MNLIGLLIVSTATLLVVVYGNAMSYGYGGYGGGMIGGGGYGGGYGGGGYGGGFGGGGIFSILICLFVFIILIRVLFQDGGLGGYGGGGKGGESY